MLCLGAKETADIRSEVAAGLYRKLLKEEVTSRRIDQAESPAKVRFAGESWWRQQSVSVGAVGGRWSGQLYGC